MSTNGLLRNILVPLIFYASLWNAQKKGSTQMAGVWAVKNHTGEVLEDFTAASRLEVGLKVVPTSYDAFRLRVSSSYRELFDRAVLRILDQKRWQIVRVR